MFAFIRIAPPWKKRLEFSQDNLFCDEDSLMSRDPAKRATQNGPMKQATYPPVKRYVPVAVADSHSTLVGYLTWVFGFTGAHRFYYGKPVTGAIWFFTFGLLGIGWIVDAFLIPSMEREAESRFRAGQYSYNVGWVLLLLTGAWGIHRLYQGKVVTGLLYLLTCGVFGLGIVYDVLTFNEQIDELNAQDPVQGYAGYVWA